MGSPSQSAGRGQFVVRVWKNAEYVCMKSSFSRGTARGFAHARISSERRYIQLDSTTT
jgi:hypothetical protein